ncbi:MAG: PD-(D/E)XK nuclease family protein, partial [Clostridia bacterium]|nr:PD-(D/E)XK nuclease family protein [Clostridia bacterium]
MNILVKAYTLSECMDALAEYVAAYEKIGMKNLIFCEDRLTLITERTVVRALGGSFFTSVTTFARFLKTDVKRLGKQGSVMAISGIMAELQKEKALKCFKSQINLTKDAQCIYETIAQFAAARVDAETLKESIDEITDPVLREKVADLALIYTRYDEFLKEKGYVDDSCYLSLLPDAIRQDQSLKNANVFFVGYSAFTKQAAEAIKAAAESAANVIGIFCGGEEAFYTNSAADRFFETCSKVGKTETKTRYYPLDGEAEVLRKSLFEPSVLKAENTKTATDKISIFEGADKADEAEKTAVNIRKLMAETEGLRYRDIAVLIPDPAAYQLPIKKAFDEYKIPYFFDEKRSLKKHPIAEFILACFEVVKENYSPVSVQKLTQNVFFGEAEEYRNYLLKYANYRGGAKNDIKDKDLVKGFDLDAVQDGKNRLTKAVKNIKPTGQGRDYCLAIQNLIKDFHLLKTLEKLCDSVDDPSLKSYLLQIDKALPVVLSDAEKLLSDRTLTVREFSAILSNGLEAMEISLIPLKTDAVYVGDLVDSRIEKVRALFALGFTDDVPRAGKDAALLADRDIKQLTTVNACVEPTVAEANLRACENFCLNLCTFSDYLYIFYPLGEKGEEPTLSEAIRYIRGAFAPTEGETIVAKKDDEFKNAEFKYICSAETPAVRRLLVEKGNKKRTGDKSRGDKYEQSQSKRFDTLYAALTELGVDAEGAVTEEKTFDHVSCGEDLFFGEGKISPTKLEKYFTCPFGNFMSNGLKLKEREESVVMSFDSGNFIHAVLEEIGRNMSNFKTEEDVSAHAREYAEKEAQKPVYAAGRDTESGKYASEALC